jgi:hypothetical protein
MPRSNFPDTSLTCNTTNPLRLSIVAALTFLLLPYMGFMLLAMPILLPILAFSTSVAVTSRILMKVSYASFAVIQLPHHPGRACQT